MGTKAGIAGALIVSIAVASLTPWQLFQSLCPYLSLQSQQCAMPLLQQQQQIPSTLIPSDSPQAIPSAPPTSMPPPRLGD
jgi:hypothetical protein